MVRRGRVARPPEKIRRRAPAATAACSSNATAPQAAQDARASRPGRGPCRTARRRDRGSGRRRSPGRAAAPRPSRALASASARRSSGDPAPAGQQPRLRSAPRRRCEGTTSEGDAGAARSTRARRRWSTPGRPASPEHLDLAAAAGQDVDHRRRRLLDRAAGDVDHRPALALEQPPGGDDLSAHRRRCRHSCCRAPR